MSDNSAHALFFGIDFQINAAIVLMLENIKELKTLRLESNYEDIDLTLNNEKHILAQAKSIENSSTDFRNVRKNLKNALRTLSAGSTQLKTEKLILITNSPNPLKEDASRSIFWGPSHRSFNSLPLSSQKIIRNYLSAIPTPLDTKQFFIQVVPFETDEDIERYKAVMDSINTFIGNLRLNIPGLGHRLHTIWLQDIFKNGSKKDTATVLQKSALIWPLIVIATDIERTNSEFLAEFDSVQYDEIVRQYHELIDSCCERIEFFTKILYDFNAYTDNASPKQKSLNFVKNCWQNYSSEFKTEGIDDDTLKGLTQIIVYNILCRRYDINKIKNGVCL